MLINTETHNFNTIFDNIKASVRLNDDHLLAKELVKVFEMGQKHILDELIDITPLEMPPLNFPFSVTAHECMEVVNMIHQPGFKDGFDVFLEGQMSLCDFIEEEL